MSEDLVYSERANHEQWEQLLYVLAQRSKPTVVIICFDTYETRNKLHRKLIEDLSHYKHYDMDLTSHNVVSLRRQFKERLPESIRNSKPVKYAVHVFGLENSILAPNTGSIKESGLISELNFEREALFHDNPFITIIWSDNYIFEKLKTEACDLWDWITYKFKFAGDSVELPAVAEPIHPPPLPRGHLPERKERINNLIKKYNKLRLKGPKKERIVREKINIQKLLGQEHLELNNYDDAIKAFKTALLLSKKIKSSQHLRMEILYRLGDVFLAARDFNTSLERYKSSLQLQIKNNINSNIASTYHQMGTVFEAQRKWSDALTHYQTAIDWYQKTDNLPEIGFAYYQMGMVFQEQQKWNDALTHYQAAIDWYQKTDNLLEIGLAYYQMGIVYQEQRKWSDAFTSGLNALQYNYETIVKRELIISHIKEILPELSLTETKDLFEKHFSPNPPERKKHCRELIWNHF